MKRIGFSLRLLTAVAVIAVGASLAHAQADNTWVKSTGSDANTATNCTIAAPCRTFAAALTVTNSKGTINALDSADFCGQAGPLVITKSVTIEGRNSVCRAPNFNFDGIQVNTLTSNDIVVIRGLTINGHKPTGVNPPTAGINYTGGASGGSTLVVENVFIQNFATGLAADLPGNTNGVAGYVYVRNSSFDSNEVAGLHFSSTGTGDARFQLDGVRAETNGIFGSGSGLEVVNRTLGTVSNSSFGGNMFYGVVVRPTTAPSVVNLESCMVAHNSQGVVALGQPAISATIRISNTDILENIARGIDYVAGSFVTSFGNNRIAGNGAGNGPPTNTLPQQ